MKCIRCGAEFDGALGQCPHCAQPAGAPAQGQGPYSQGGSPYSQNPYGQGGGPYSQGGGPYSQGGSPYGQSPYGQGGGTYSQGGSPYGQGPYGQGQGGAPVAPGSPPKAKLSLATKLIALGVVAAAVVAAVVIVNVRRVTQYREQMELGYRYLGQGQYEEAILAFNAAIEIDPKNAQPYAGLGDAYAAGEMFDEALSSYSQAITLDSGLADAYTGLANTYIDMGDVEAALEALDSGIRSVNSESGDMSRWREVLASADGTAVLRGTVAEYLPGGGSGVLPEARVRLYLTADDRPLLVRSVETGAEGTFALEGLAGGDYLLRVDAADHIGIETAQTLTDGMEHYAELLVLIPEPTEETNPDGAPGTGEPGEPGTDEERSLTATITNAIDGSGVEGALVILRDGWNNRDGEMSTEAAVADEYGNVTFDGLDYGYYTAEVRANRFTSAYHNVAVVPEGYFAEWNLPVTPMLEMGELRIVLTWGATPSDLDSHLYNDDFHVYFERKNYYDGNGLHRVNLDLDDTSSYGPETVTIYRNLGADCTYYVKDYSNSGRKNSTALSTSGAMVQVYRSSGLVATYHVPADCAGDIWTVFTLKRDGSIETVNTVS